MAEKLKSSTHLDFRQHSNANDLACVKHLKTPVFQQTAEGVFFKLLF